MLHLSDEFGLFSCSKWEGGRRRSDGRARVGGRGAPKAKCAEKVHKPTLWVNIINFELNRLDASIWVPLSPSDPKSHDTLIANKSLISVIIS